MKEIARKEYTNISSSLDDMLKGIFLLKRFVLKLVYTISVLYLKSSHVQVCRWVSQ